MRQPRLQCRMLGSAHSTARIHIGQRSASQSVVCNLEGVMTSDQAERVDQVFHEPSHERAALAGVALLRHCGGEEGSMMDGSAPRWLYHAISRASLTLRLPRGPPLR
jgi:hypothetical protein